MSSARAIPGQPKPKPGSYSKSPKGLSNSPRGGTACQRVRPILHWESLQRARTGLALQSLTGGDLRKLKDLLAKTDAMDPHLQRRRPVWSGSKIKHLSSFIIQMGFNLKIKIGTDENNYSVRIRRFFAANTLVS